MWQRFSERARKVVFFAQEEAQREESWFVGPTHLLLGVLRMPDSSACQTLTRMGCDFGVLKKLLTTLPPGGAGLSTEMTLSPAGKRVIDHAYDEARTMGNNFIGTEHLLLGLIHDRECGAHLKDVGVELVAARLTILGVQADLDITASPSRLVPPRTQEHWVAGVTLSRDERGTWISGTIHPDLTHGQEATLFVHSCDGFGDFFALNQFKVEGNPSQPRFQLQVPNETQGFRVVSVQLG